MLSSSAAAGGTFPAHGRVEAVGLAVSLGLASAGQHSEGEFADAVSARFLS